MRRVIAAVMTVGLVISPMGGPVTAMAQQPKGGTIVVSVQRVLTNVVVRDKKTGALIKGLKPSDFTVMEDKKQQKITSFDYQNVDEAVTLAEEGNGLRRDGDQAEVHCRPCEQRLRRESG